MLCICKGEYNDKFYMEWQDEQWRGGSGWNLPGCDYRGQNQYAVRGVFVC